MYSSSAPYPKRRADCVPESLFASCFGLADKMDSSLSAGIVMFLKNHLHPVNSFFFVYENVL